MNQRYSEVKEINKDVDFNEEIYETKFGHANKKLVCTKDQQILFLNKK